MAVLSLEEAMAGPGASPQLWDRQTVGLSLWELHEEGVTPLERCKPSKTEPILEPANNRE